MALFTSFFPQLIQGPISRFGELSQTLYAPHRFDFRTVWFGLERVLWGYFKKLVIADRIVVAVNAIVGQPDIYSGFYVFCGMLFYAAELYADFTGGIDITIGIAQMFGIQLAENFERPYFSKILRNTGADGTLPWERGLRIICFIRCLRPCRCCRCLHSAGDISARRQAGGFRCIL